MPEAVFGEPGALKQINQKNPCQILSDMFKK